MTDAVASQVKSMGADLDALIEGDARFDEVTRVLYSTGACMYRIKPLGVVFPKSREDVIATVRYAADRGISLVPRGGAAPVVAGRNSGQASC